MKKRENLLVFIIFLTLAFIWGHSLMSREVSSEESGFVMQLLTPLLELFVGKGNVTEHLVRKLAHFSEFALLGAELCLYFTGKRKRKSAGLLLALAHGLFAAFFDETLQIFSGRGPMIQDVWIDFAGVITGALCILVLMTLCIYVVQKRKAKT